MGKGLCCLPVLGVASQGPGVLAAKRSLREAVELWFESCIERGVLDEALRELGFRPTPWGTSDRPGESVVRVSRSLAKDEVRGDEFPVTVQIPAYHAAALLSAGA